MVSPSPPPPPPPPPFPAHSHFLLPLPLIFFRDRQNEKLLADATRLRQISERIPANRWGAPWDFAGPVLFLASDASRYVSGEMLVVDGGWMGR